MAQDLTFFFAWVDPTETTFGPQHMRWDEHIFSKVIEQDEGQIPTMKIVIRNPMVPLLGAGRKYWAWLAVSTDGGVTAQPQFFGRLVGLPTELNPTSLVVELKFIARPVDYVQQKQALAETLKVLPYYDPVFVNLLKRDDPDTIIEGYSSLYHVDRVTGVVSTSDVLIGEDGTAAFTGVGDAFYDSVKMRLHQSPLVAVNVKANVGWTQQWIGFMDVTKGQIATFTGEAFINDWPKTGAGLGGGYTVSVGFAANATRAIDLAQTKGNYGYHYHWQNTQKSHNTGDTMSVDISYSIPLIGGSFIPRWFGYDTSSKDGSIIYTYRRNITGGLQETFTVDVNGDPDPTNKPATADVAWLVFPQWNASYVLSMRYDAHRRRTERAEFTLRADVQPTITDALAIEDMEVISLSGQDVSLPIINLRNWQSIAGQAVADGDYVFPNNPYAVGQTSIQVAVAGGVAGIIEPLFSNIPGQTTNDGTVTWSSLGPTPPSDQLPDWQRFSPTARGTIMCPRPVAAQDVFSLTAPGGLVYPPRMTAVSQYQLISFGYSGPGSLIEEVMIPGFLDGFPFGLTNLDSPAVISGFTNPTGKCAWLCTGAGTTGQVHVTFPDTPGAVVTDGTVTWTNIGFVDLPIGGWPGFTGARSYFPSDRGLQSLENLILRARAKLRWRARAAQVTWESPYAAALGLSCRMNASLVDPRLPGGYAAGKVISYRLSADGDSGKFTSTITIGCSVGTGNVLHPISVVQDYVDSDYIEDGYFDVVGEEIIVAGGLVDDVGYTPPAQGTVDDGLIFPVTIDDVLLSQTWGGSVDMEKVLIRQAVESTYFGELAHRTFPASAVGGTASYSVTEPDYLSMIYAAEDARRTGVWYALSLRPLTNGPFDAGYVIQTTDLMIPQTINLE